MLKLENHLGTTTITGQYFADLIGNCVSDCYGVVGIAAKTPVQGLMRYISGKDDPAQGVKVKNIGNKLVVEIPFVATDLVMELNDSRSKQLIIEGLPLGQYSVEEAEDEDYVQSSRTQSVPVGTNPGEAIFVNRYRPKGRRQIS